MPWSAEKARLALVQRQPDAESSAAAYLTVQFDAPAVRAHDSLDDHQTQTAAFLLRGKEGFENPIDLLLGNAAAGVSDADPAAVGPFAGLKSERAAFGHRLEGILNQIDEHLLNLRRA